MKKHWPKFKKITLQLITYFFFISVSMVVFYRFVPVYYTPLMILRSAESVFDNKFVGIDKTWESLDNISPSIQKAVLKAEDDRFFEHYGFDFDAIQKAMKYNQTHKRKKGASTISQQTAKNVFLWPARDWLRKGLEVYFTVLIEIFWPKSRIMEVYLNVVELGPGVYGVEAASQKYFKRSAKNLTSGQASLMAAVLPNPRRFRIDRPSNYVTNRQFRILNRVAPPIPKDDATSLSDFFDIKLDESDESEDTKD